MFINIKAWGLQVSLAELRKIDILMIELSSTMHCWAASRIKYYLGTQAIMLINIEIRRNDRLSAAQ